VGHPRCARSEYLRGKKPAREITVKDITILKLDQVEYEGKLRVTDSECLRRGESSGTLKSKEKTMYLVLCLRQPALEVRTECWTHRRVCPQAEIAVRMSLDSRQVFLTDA